MNELDLKFILEVLHERLCSLEHLCKRARVFHDSDPISRYIEAEDKGIKRILNSIKEGE